MSHAHTHEEESHIYYVDQLCTIGTTAALAGVMILLWWNSTVLALVLNDSLHILVLLSGIALLVLVAIRCASMWIAVGQSRPATCEPGDGHEHDHCHDHDHGHAHVHAEHKQPPVQLPVLADHGHEHGWAPWRYAVMIVPVILFLLGIPSLAEDPPEQGVVVLKQQDVEKAAASPAVREEWKRSLKDEVVRIRGMAGPLLPDQTIRLRRSQMQCCIADAIPIWSTIRVEIPRDVDVAPLQNQWIKAIGIIEFRETPGTEEYVPVLKVKDSQSIAPIRKPANECDP